MTAPLYAVRLGGVIAAGAAVTLGTVWLARFTYLFGEALPHTTPAERATRAMLEVAGAGLGCGVIPIFALSLAAIAWAAGIDQ